MRLKFILLILLSAFASVAAQAQSVTTVPPKALPVDSSSTNLPPRALPVAPSSTPPPRAIALTPDEIAAANAPVPVVGGVNVHWYGHGFVLLTSSVGIRCAIDPFGSETVRYPFPAHLSADFVLVTHEAEDHDAADQIFGNPLIFRSVMAVGLNRANGIPFYGVSLQKDNTGHGGANTAFTLTFDGVKFGYLGQISAPLLGQEKEELGHVDVLFLPVGLQTLSVAEFNDLARSLGAKIIIPINYQTDFSGNIPLRSLDDYLEDSKLPTRKFDTNEIAVTRDSLPADPTIYVLKSP